MYGWRLKITLHLKGVVLDGPVKQQNAKIIPLKEARKLEMVLNKCMRRRMEVNVSTLSNVALICGYLSPCLWDIDVCYLCFQIHAGFPSPIVLHSRSNSCENQNNSNLQELSEVNSCVSFLSSLSHSVTCCFLIALHCTLFRYCVRHQDTRQLFPHICLISC